MPDQPLDIVEIFCTYSHQDEDLKSKLEAHLSGLRRQQLIALWSDRKIVPGDEWKGKIDEHLENAEIILLLISADFIASDYCYDLEMKRALERYYRSEARVIPISLRPVDWAGLPFARLQALPKDAKPITTWANQDEAFVDVTKGIREIVLQVKQATQSLPMQNATFRTSLKELLGLWTLVLNVATANVDGRTLKSILEALRWGTGKPKLTLQRVEGDPATLTFLSPRAVFEKIQSQSRQILMPQGIEIGRMEWKSAIRQGRIVR